MDLGIKADFVYVRIYMQTVYLRSINNEKSFDIQCKSEKEF